MDVTPKDLTDVILCPMFPPAISVNITTDIADPIAPNSCLSVLFIAVASSTSYDTTLIVHVIAGVNANPAPMHLIICVIII